MAATRLTRAAARLVQILGGDCAIAGGLAVNAYGYVRATRDIDVIALTSLEAARRRLTEQGVVSRVFRGDAFEDDFTCLKGVLGGVPFDVLPPLVPIEPERLVRLDLHEVSLPIVDFETLVRLKLKAGGPKDLLDLAMLVNLRPERRTRTLEMAAYDPQLQSRLLSMVDDPRVKRDVAERSAEVRLLGPSRRKRGARAEGEGGSSGRAQAVARRRRAR